MALSLLILSEGLYPKKGKKDNSVDGLTHSSKTKSIFTLKQRETKQENKEKKVNNTGIK